MENRKDMTDVELNAQESQDAQEQKPQSEDNTELLTSIEVSNLVKEYPLRGNENTTFKALDNISLKIKHGERVGIIGSNGAGKSTLLNILSRYSEATSGNIDIKGTISAMLSIGTSINEHMTGRENLYQGAELYGFKKEQVEDKIEEIIDFIDIGEYIDFPLHTYSSGMKARLAFGITFFVEPEILIIDEVLGVGDTDFAIKSSKRLRELCNNGKILLIVSHSIHAIQDFSDRCIWIEHGKIKMDGDTETVSRQYMEYIGRKEAKKMNEQLAVRLKKSNVAQHSEITALDIFRNGETEPTVMVGLYDSVTIKCDLLIKETILYPDVVLQITGIDDTKLWANHMKNECDLPAKWEAGEHFSISIEMPDFRIAQGTWELLCQVFSENELAASRLYTFEVINTKHRVYNTSLYYPPYSIEYSTSYPEANK